MVGALLKALTFQVKEVCAFLVGEPSSATIIVTLYGLAASASFARVPEILPVEELMASPEGNPLAL